MIKKLIVKEEGQGLVEYTLIIVLISIAAVFTMTGTGTQLNNMYVEIKDKVTAAMSADG